MYRMLSSKFRVLGSVLGWLLVMAGPASIGTAQTPAASAAFPGVLAEFSVQGVRDFLVLPGVAFRVEPKSSPTPFLAAGPFSATLTTAVRVDLRSDFHFQLDLSGTVEVKVNGAGVLSASGEDVSSPASKLVRLNKGLNEVSIQFTSPTSGPAFLRLNWAEKPFLLQPIPWAQLSHRLTSEATKALERSSGREAFLEFRCVRCHAAPGGTLAEMSMDAPSFEGMGNRRNREWMERWILDPRSLRPTAHMPRVFSGADAPSKAAAAAAYLSSLRQGGDVTLKDPAPWTSLSPVPAEGVGESKPLFEKLHCVACHTSPSSAESDPEKLDLKQIAAKFSTGKLAEFLRKPDAHYAWIRMPNFRLTSAEAEQLATFLIRAAESAPTPGPDPSEDLIAKGRGLVAESGCLNCHKGPASSSLVVAEFGKIPSDSWTKGCLAPESGQAGRAPWYGLSSRQRSALAAFGKTDLAALKREVPLEFATRHSTTLRCASCHGQFDGFPSFEALGSKLNTPWMRAFIAGEIPYKPRAERHPKGEPWLDARMPAFGPYSAQQAEGMSLLNGFGSAQPVEAPIQAASVEIGRTLLGKNGGFSCVSCHAINKSAALEVFESEGLNLAHSAERLRRSYFHRWMRLPIAIDPQTKMPAYFDEEGQSPLSEILGGDAVRQLDAIWEYLRQGEAMVPPAQGAAP